GSTPVGSLCDRRHAPGGACTNPLHPPFTRRTTRVPPSLFRPAGSRTEVSPGRHPQAMSWTRRWDTLLRYRAAAPPGALPVRGAVHAVRGAVRAGRGLVPAGPGPHAPARSPAPFALTPQWRAPGPCGARRPRSARPGRQLGRWPRLPPRAQVAAVVAGQAQPGTGLRPSGLLVEVADPSPAPVVLPAAGEPLGAEAVAASAPWGHAEVVAVVGVVGIAAHVLAAHVSAV